ncbi:nickel/cobalt efflux transporter [Allorhizobium sp. BGMRC 0089]|uniref:nickel/cobalt efflux transporter n=1 Tax=Allorhizobium sonneratiae TaxID=2934936 RepID=UPI0020337EF2|nr:nickel/cobalt efflux transporter [Allorhizobium sonneratiae]MCM2294647.1 nickel/cobalt efflux transporter [Allorhizobium sonneratiae]
MNSLTDLLQQGTAHAWLFIPTAILLGALHGLEPGHSKTMMAAFIIAVRGTVKQAILLGLAAAISHTAVVWLVALGGQYLGRGMNADTSEPYFQIASAVIIVGIAFWMLWRTWREQQLEAAHHHDHHHHHDDETRRIDTGHGIMTLEVFEDGVPPRFRIRFERGHGWFAKDVTLVTERADGSRQAFTFAEKGGYLESVQEIPEPHAFNARVSLGHGNHTHDYDLAFSEGDHSHAGLDVNDGEYMDAHERAHANDIARRFQNQSVTTWQIVMFGLTGGLIPCPAAITVLLLCLQLKQLSLGAVLVLCFSIGLAITMVSAGVLASLSVRHVQKRWSGFSSFARRAPYASGALMLLIALYMGFAGIEGLQKDHLQGVGARIAEMVDFRL